MRRASMRADEPTWRMATLASVGKRVGLRGLTFPASQLDLDCASLFRVWVIVDIPNGSWRHMHALAIDNERVAYVLYRLRHVFSFALLRSKRFLNCHHNQQISMLIDR